MPLAPACIVRCTVSFMARLKATRFSSCSAMLRATSTATRSGWRTSRMLTGHALAGLLLQQLAQLLDVGAALADDDARLGGVDRHA